MEDLVIEWLDTTEAKKEVSMFFVYDIEGMDEPMGPFNLRTASEVLLRQGNGWSILTEKVAKCIWKFSEQE
jgi:hypothetical protein